MSKEEKKVFSLIQNVSKNVDTKKWECLFPGCNSISINSHFLQKNGILNNLAENGHLIEVGINDIFSFEQKGMTAFKERGINQAISDSLFCNEHDTSLFLEIESGTIDIYNYKTQLLFSYRSLCGELRKKIKNVEFFRRLVNVKALPELHQMYSTEALEREIVANKIGIDHMDIYKRDMELEITTTSSPAKFEFSVFEYPEIKLCASAVFSPILRNEIVARKNNVNSNPLKYVFINVFPKENNLYIIVGYHIDYVNDWIKQYISSWNELDEVGLQNQLTNLIATRVETWNLSPILFGNISNESKQRLISYWEHNGSNLLAEQTVDFNLFDNVF